ncbi:hypothetical protein [Hyalangium rubrum]|uniref:Lipoprotein n=1 Tax=Hyalangium rubrum TaxID=3103134 RepID=A0ABU5H2Q8_9BACT|nr:hypothetical protein [Hyalangium sp. s54d21]MDY7227747.1 hypothetical protein [Hyalangium sp. s54d21]
MKLWRYIRRVLWAVGISGVVLLATVECLSRATFTRLPQLPPNPPGAAASARLAPALGRVEERAAAPRVLRVLPWALLRVLTATLRARKGQSRMSEYLLLKGREVTEWTWLLPKMTPAPKAEPLWSGLGARAWRRAA